MASVVATVYCFNGRRGVLTVAQKAVVASSVSLFICHCRLMQSKRNAAPYSRNTPLAAHVTATRFNRSRPLV